MNPTDLESDFRHATTTDSVSVHLSFIPKLLDFTGEDALEYHWNLLHRLGDNQKLYYHVRAAFAKRGKSAEEFLKTKMDLEPNRELRADALQLLGKLRSNVAPVFAREFLNHSHSDGRFRGIIVLGWGGMESTIKNLK